MDRDLAGVTALRGRLFVESDDRPGAPPVAILTEGIWRRKYGGDPGVLPRTVDMDGVPRQVIGIVADRVQFPMSDTGAWIPLALNPLKTDSASFDYEAVGRLREGVSTADAQSELQALLERLPAELPGRLTRASIAQTHMRASVRPLADVIVGDCSR